VDLFPMQTMANPMPGDLKTEVHFIGQIVGAGGFDLPDSGLFCEAQLEYGEHWQELPNKLEHSIQTQTSYPNPEDFVVWAHSIDFHFATESIFGWPKMLFRVWRLDLVGRIDLIAYGVASLPSSAGYFEVQCPTWRPLGKWHEETMAFFVGGPPRLTSQDVLTKNAGDRAKVASVAGGVVHLQLEVILRNFDNHFAGGQMQTVVERTY